MKLPSNLPPGYSDRDTNNDAGDYGPEPKRNPKAKALAKKKRVALIKRPMSDIHNRGFKSTDSFEPGNEKNK